MKTTYGKPVVAPDDILAGLDALIPRGADGTPLAWVTRSVSTLILAEAVTEIERLRARVEVLTNLLGYFTGRNDDHIQVMLAGNPYAIEDLLSRVDAAMKETET